MRAHQEEPDAVDVLVQGRAEALVVVGREHVVHLLAMSRAWIGQGLIRRYLVTKLSTCTTAPGSWAVHEATV